METPKTLLEAVKYFSDADNALAYLVNVRWPNGVTCPYCEAVNPMFLASRRIWKCRNGKCGKQFSIKVGSIMEDSPIGLDKWLSAMWLLANCKNGISSYEVARDLGVTQKSAWFLLHRVREAMQDEVTGGMLAGEVEVDETFIGGKARNMHSDDRARKIKGRGPEGKAIVAAVLERGGKVRARVVETRRKHSLQKLVNDNVKPGSSLYSDALKSYEGLGKTFEHQVIDHAVEYVRENVHTNGMENFWSLLKRGIHGTYISTEPFHLFRYVDEQAFRFNNRKREDGDVITDAERFHHVCRKVTGKRLTWNKLTGKDAEAKTT
jgi:transposase-like protein